MEQTETIIVGGGGSWLACGKTLHDMGRDFLLVTEEIGGRMLTSKSHEVNYVDSYITEDYKNILPSMGGGRRVWTLDCFFQ